jgi:hypothetical protein
MTRATYATWWQEFHDKQDWAQWDRVCHHMYDAEPVAWEVNPMGKTRSAWHEYLSFRQWARGATSELAKYCLNVAVTQARDAAQANAFERKIPPGSFPQNRLNFLSAKVFIDGFVNRAPLDKTEVLQIAKDEAEIAPTYGRREWDGLPQSEYLHTIELLLLVDAREEAQAMVNNARGMRGLNVKELFDNAKLILKSKTPVRDNPEAKAQYRRMFDLLRDPNYPDRRSGHPAFLPQLLIMACMWQKFYEPGAGGYDYDRAIDLLWE